MISLNKPIGDGGAELGDLYGEWDDPSTAVENADAVGVALKSLRPLDRALLTAVHANELPVEVAAERLEVSVATVVRRLRKSERTARGEQKKYRKPPSRPLAGVEAQVGDIRRRLENGKKVAYIKLQMKPPTWLVYSRFVWQNAHGPVPHGKIVLHKNGDAENDALENLVLGTVADNAAIFLHSSESNYQRNRKACAAGAAKANAERAVAKNLLGIVRPQLWYVVDHAGRTITGPVGRSCHMAYVWLGVAKPKGWATSRRAWLSAQLGWPGLTAMSAVVLHALAAVGERGIPLAELPIEAERLYAYLGEPLAARPLTATMSSTLWILKNQGLAARAGTNPTRYRATAKAATALQPCHLVAVVRGKVAEKYKDAGYAVRPPLTPSKPLENVPAAVGQDSRVSTKGVLQPCPYTTTTTCASTN